MNGSFSSVDIVELVFGAVFLLSGLATLFTGKVYLMGKSAEKYTEESLKKYAPLWGISNILCAAGLVCYTFLNETPFTIGSFSISLGLAILLGVIILELIIFVLGKKILVKK